MFKCYSARTIVKMALIVAGIIVAGTLLFYSVIKTDMINEKVYSAVKMADTIIKSTRYTMLTDDRVTLANMIDNIGGQEGVEHIQIFNKKGLIMFSSRHGEIGSIVDKKAAGCVGCHVGPVATTMMGRMEQARRYVGVQGKNVLAITAPIYNEPDCSDASCHFHPAGQKVLGTLDIGLFEESLQKPLVVIKRRILAFCALMLMLTAAGAVFLFRTSAGGPVKELSEYVDRVESGQLDVEPPQSDDEIGAVGQSFRRMAVKLDATLVEIDTLKAEKKILEQKLAATKDSSKT